MANYKARYEFKPGKLIYIPTDECVVAGRRIVSQVNSRWRPPSWFYHLARGGHVAALEAHVSNVHFARLDIANFFASVTRSKIKRSLMAIGFSFLDANDVASISTVKQPRGAALPYGFVQSPCLASLALFKSKLGKTLQRIARSDVALSVYVDDILLSHPASADVVQSNIDQVREAASSSSFGINEDKSQGPNLSITAFNVTLANHSLTVTEERFLDFRAKIMRRGPSYSSDAIIAYVRKINSDQADQLVAEL